MLAIKVVLFSEINVSRRYHGGDIVLAGHHSIWRWLEPCAPLNKIKCLYFM